MKTITTTALFAASSFLTLQSATVNWGGDYVSADQSLNLSSDGTAPAADYGYGTASNDALQYDAFQSGTALIDPLVNLNYTGPALYGTFQTGREDGLGTNNISSVNSRSEIRNNGANDQIVVGSNNNRILSSVLLFQAGGGGLDTLSITVDEYAPPATPSAGSPIAGLRFMVENAGTFYVSETTYTSTGTHVLSGTDFANELWVPVTLNDGSFTNTNYAISGGSTQTFTDVDWVGVSGTWFYTAGGDEQYVVSGFSASVIPEPSTIVLVGMSFLSLLGFMRRKRLDY